MSNSTKDFLEKLRNLVQKHSVEPGKTYKFMKESVTDKGVKIFTEADEFAEGVEVFVDIEGVISAAPEGPHTLEDGTIIEVVSGLIDSITKQEEEEEVAAATAALDAALSKMKLSNTKLSAENAKLSADHAVIIAAKTAEITKLKSENVILSAQVKSVQDTADKKADVSTRPATWHKMSVSQRSAWFMENPSN